jgi:hypothetical protein
MLKVAEGSRGFYKATPRIETKTYNPHPQTTPRMNIGLGFSFRPRIYRINE